MRFLVSSGSSSTPPHPPFSPLVSVISGSHQLRHSEDFHSLVELAPRRCEASSLVQFGIDPYPQPLQLLIRHTVQIREG